MLEPLAVGIDSTYCETEGGEVCARAAIGDATTATSPAVTRSLTARFYGRAVRDLATVFARVSSASRWWTIRSRVGHADRARAYLLPAGLAAAIAVVGYEDGFFEPDRQLGLAVAVWWLLAVALFAGILPLARVRRGAAGIVAPLALLAAWTALSALWASDAGTAANEGARVFLYLAVVVLASLAASRSTLRGWVFGLTLGASAVVLIALASRLFPHLFSNRGLLATLPAVAGRLSFPLGYWNAVGAVVGLAAPLLLGCVLGARSAVARAAALGVVPAAAATVYLTSSRGGMLAAAVGAAVVVALTSDRWAAIAATALGGLGGGAAIEVLRRRRELVNGPVGGTHAVADGRSAFLLLVLVCSATAVVALLGARALGPKWRPPRLVGVVLAGLAIATAAVLLVLVHPVARLHAFEKLPVSPGSANFADTHLLSGSGSGRWQFWSAAVSEFRAHPVLGGGAGSFEAWWLRHASFRYHVSDAHSLYLETLGELGIVGLALLLTFLGAVGVAAVRLARRAGPGMRPLVAGLAGCVAAYAVAAGLDWMWEIPGVTLVAMVAAGLLAAASTGGEAATRAARGRVPALAAAGTAAVVAGLVGVLFLAQLSLAASRHAAAGSRTSDAWAAARGAESLEPWSFEPALQLALLAEVDGRLAEARSWIDAATARAPDDWTLWLVAARIETKQEDLAAAVRSYQRARRLNPRSSLLASLGP